LKFTDRAAIGTVKTTSEGYVTALARAVRTGVQDYGAWENDELLAMAIAVGKNKSDIIKVYRPPESVFNKDSLKSAIHIPVTIDHPSEMVDAANWKDLAVGEVGSDVMRDGEMVAWSLMLKDAKAVDIFRSGKAQLSAGYMADMEIAPEGSPYDYVMGPPTYNHLAIVDRARAGKDARIGDSWGASPVTTSKEVTMTDFTKVVIGDKQFTVAASDADQFTALLADKDAAIGELKAELADAESKILSDEALAAKVKEMADMAVMREAVKAKFGDEAIKDASDAEIKGMHRVLDKAMVADDTARKALSDRKQADIKDNGQAAYEAKLANAWKGV
jgi:hypothetical protein